MARRKKTTLCLPEVAGPTQLTKRQSKVPDKRVQGAAEREIAFRREVPNGAPPKK
jgi:hypothetical protein